MANNVLTLIPDHFTTQFDANWKHLVQQKNSRLREYVTLFSLDGIEGDIFAQLGIFLLNEVFPVRVELGGVVVWDVRQNIVEIGHLSLLG